MIRDHEAISRYLDEVCSRIRALEAHREIRHELENHLEELVLEQEEEGIGRDETILWAIRQMGNPAEVGDGLHSVHRPRMHWGLFVGVMVFVVFGIFAMYAVEEVMTKGHNKFDLQYLKLKIWSVSIGVVFMGILYFLNYLKIRSYSYGLYFVIILGMLFTKLFGNQVNGTSYLHLPYFSIDWFGISPYLFMVAAPGMIMSWENTKRFWLLTTTAFLIVPMVFFLSFSTIGNFMLYMAGYLLLLRFMTKSWRGILIQGITMCLFALLGILQRQYQMERLTAFLNPDKDPQGAGYLYHALEAGIRSAGWRGRGIGEEMPQPIPDIPTNNIIVFLIYRYGWWIGILILISLVYLVGRLIQSNRDVREPYGRLLGAAVAGMLSFQMVYSLLMPFGLAPLVGIPFHFLSYGGSHLFIEMAVMGLVLGIYRRKDLVRSSGIRHAQRP